MRQPIVESLPSGSTGIWSKRVARLEDVRILEVSRKVIDCLFLSIFADRNDVEWEVNACIHSALLRSPSRSHNAVRRDVHVRNGARFDLCQITTEITDNISAFEICRKALKPISDFALGTGKRLRHELLAELTGYLPLGGQRRPHP